MSAVNQETSTETIVDQGPQEIVFAHEVAAREPETADVTDVEVKTPATSEPETDETDETDETAAVDEPVENRDEKGRFKGVQNRIDDLTRARREAERDAAYWKARAEGAAGAAQNPAQPAVPKPPKPDDFQTPEAYQDAVIDYRVEQKLNEKLAHKDVEQKAQQEFQERASSWQGRLAEARESTPGFDDALAASEVLIAPHVSELLVDHDAGAKLLHHLAIHPEIGEKLNGMTVSKAATELAKIAVGFAPAVVVESKPVSKPVTTAPAPIKPIGSNRTTTPSVEDMEMDDYVAMRKKQGAHWAR